MEKKLVICNGVNNPKCPKNHGTICSESCPHEEHADCTSPSECVTGKNLPGGVPEVLKVRCVPVKKQRGNKEKKMTNKLSKVAKDLRKLAASTKKLSNDVYRQIRSEFPTWTREDIEWVINTHSSKISEDARKIQERYEELTK